MATWSAANHWLRALQSKARLDSSPHATLLSMIEDRAQAHPDHPALIGETGELTYGALLARAWRYADWALSQDLPHGAIVGLMMPNCPDYVAIWLGLTQAGCTVALINPTLVGDALAHAVRVAGARHLIVAGELLAPNAATFDHLPAAPRIWLHGDGAAQDYPRIDHLVRHNSDHPGDALRARRPSRQDRALLIYTSGTTGLPKGANITHDRVLDWSVWFAGMMDARPDDRLYNCLPMYHSTGGVVAIGAMLVSGGSVMIRRRFSAGRFWDDIVEGDCTIFQYIGELCRYLARSEPHKAETSHRLRLFCGNGMRGDVWESVRDRFRIPRVLEFYAATEGHVSLYNCEAKPGAIGRIPPFLSHRFPVELIRTDIASGQPVRDAAGHCIRCAVDEPGEAIGRIDAGEHSPAKPFDGYSDRKATEAKVLQDVFAPGDRWFRTGDLMRKDKGGYFYFIDRLGDTFRWKGENVSTTEVAAVIAACPGVIDAVVYGVAIPQVEGRAGMAAITTGPDFSFAALAAHLRANLPAYARPVFVRLCRDIVMTGTFKLTKHALAQEGLHPPAATDTIWFHDATSTRFVACDASLKQLICSGGMRI